MVVCLVSPHTRDDDTTKRWSRNGTVGPGKSPFLLLRTILGIGFKFLPKIHHSKYPYAWSAIAFFLASWFSGKTNSFVAVIFMGRSEDGTEPG